ncbi:Dolichyl-diphosphooligosaccharide--protein glycosyltransferase subunit dad-1 [Golovinomyces cichoracearum]|uniref:Dolichyl-diphosphooligosaccharide--protein glycosyltransferase subunit OST2 n=1 Tax=Golovinomyces cichoracearum TaxID=62708 RepID=A0A420J4L6_9PEZI|nr:Dolichyl-diphosphooligosaccharide--protein glycosyltransferase subunit dad-1 [Golovinomyces cichoracearum]
MAPKRSAREATNLTNTASKTSATDNNNEHQTPYKIALGIWRNYIESASLRTNIVDVFMAFLFIVGVFQFIYCIMAGNYPFNAFLSGFSATVGQFVLTAILRIQTNEKNKHKFMQISPERAFADYVFGSLLLHFFCINFIN